eukprot:jgi/Bigna1/127398/aug1.4_g2106
MVGNAKLRVMEKPGRRSDAEFARSLFSKVPRRTVKKIVLRDKKENIRSRCIADTPYPFKPCLQARHPID